MSDWSAYLAEFHRERSGITEDVLARAHDEDGLDPYSWLRDALPAAGPVLDLACGSAPLAALLARRGWIGTDSSGGELGAARLAGAGPLLRSDASALPFASGAVPVLACSMALMLLPLPAALDEIARVLAPGGTVVATMPVQAPLTAADRWRYARVMLALHRRGLSYPNDGALADAAGLLARAGLRLVDDSARRFAVRLRTTAEAERLLDSFYLPGLDEQRRAAGHAAAHSWVGHELGLPIRRLVAVREGGT